MILKRDAFLRDLPQLRQRENLVTSAVGQNRPIPIHELMEAAEMFDHVEPRPHEQVIGVAQDDLSFHFAQLARTHRFDAALRSNRHEGWGLDHAMRSFQATSACSCVLIGRRQFKHRRHLGK